MTEGQKTKERFWRGNNPVAYGVAISSIILIGYFVMGLRQQCIGTVCETNFQIFWESDPNEIGDTLAGLFSALAFVWIIVTVFLQSFELRAQRKEFREQREATQDMARAMDAQKRLLEAEKLQRQEDRTGRVLNRLLEGLAFEINLESEEANLLDRGRLQKPLRVFANRKSEDLDTYLRLSSSKIHEFWFHHNGEHGDGAFDGWIGYYENILEYLEDILALQANLGKEDTQRIRNLGIAAFAEDARQFVNSNVWGDYCGVKPEFKQ